MNNLEFFGLILIFIGLWIAFEFYRAPMMDDNGKITKPGKTLKDLWRKRK